MTEKNNQRTFYIFIALYALSYMCNAVYSTFIPVYLNTIGYSKSSIGVLLSLAPIVAILGQPLWGTLSDRAKTKNTVLKILILGSAFSVLFYRVSTGFFYLSFIITCFTFFQTSINPMSDAISLEYMQNTQWQFGHIRLAGTLGYSFMAALAGFLLVKSVDRMFVIYFILGLMTFASAVLLPNVKGHQSGGKKVAPWLLFKDRNLMTLILFALVIQITLGFYYTFFSIYYQQLGATRTLIGWASFASGISEVPFLLLAHKILKKVKTQHALVFAGCAAAVRWLLFGVSANLAVILSLQVIHGMIYIVIVVSIATYINESVPKELKASGQALAAVFGTGIARVIGSLLGGYLSDIFGIRRMFVYNSVFVFASVLIFIMFLQLQKKYKVKS